MNRFKILRVSLSLAMIFVIISSCEDIEQFDIANGGEHVGVNMAPPGSIPYKRGETDNVNIPYNPVQTSDISITSYNVSKQLIVAAGTSDVITYSNQTGDAFTQTMAELYADVPVDGTTYSDDTMAPGDYWTFNFEMVLSDGRVLKGSTTTAETDVEFTCPSELAGDYGTYTVWTDYYGVVDTNDWTESFTDAGDGLYTITDLSGGMEPIIWGNPPVEAIVKEVCGKITLFQVDYLYGYSIDEGMVNPDGTITIKWRNVYDEFGENTYTLQ